MISPHALRDERHLLLALQASPYPLFRPPDGLLAAAGRMTPRLYEVFVLHRTVQTLAGLFPAWEPRFPPGADLFLKHPVFRLQLPAHAGELIWQRSYPNVRGLGLRSMTRDMRPDLVIERPDQVFVIEPKYRFSKKAALGNLDRLHVYRDALIDAADRRVVRFGVAVTPVFERTEALYYQAGFFAETGLGLVYEPPVPDEGRPDGLLMLDQALERYLASLRARPPGSARPL